MGHRERHVEGCRAHEKSQGGPGVPRITGGGFQKSQWIALVSRERHLEGSGPTERLLEISGVLEGSGRALGCKGKQKKSFGVQ